MIDAGTQTRGRVIDLMVEVVKKEVKDKELRRKIDRSFRLLADSHDSYLAVKGIRGMSRFGGKFSVPIFVELLNKPSGEAKKTIIDELSKYPDPQGAEAVANKLSDDRLREKAEE